MLKTRAAVVAADPGPDEQWDAYEAMDQVIRLAGHHPAAHGQRGDRPEPLLGARQRASRSSARAARYGNEGYGGDAFINGFLKLWGVVTAGGGLSARLGDQHAPRLAARPRRSTRGGLAKWFGAQPALAGVDLTARRGEVVALLGENGSGKSTLVKILAGYHEPEPGGELRVAGTPVPLPVPPGGYREIGLSFVFQDLGLAPGLRVVENLFVGRRAAPARPGAAGRSAGAPSGGRRAAVLESYGSRSTPPRSSASSGHRPGAARDRPRRRRTARFRSGTAPTNPTTTNAARSAACSCSTSRPSSCPSTRRSSSSTSSAGSRPTGPRCCSSPTT